MNLTESIIFLTNRVGRLLANDIRNRVGEECEGILPTHIGIMVDLWTKDGVRQQDLAISVIKDKGTIARALNGLEQLGMVLRIPDEHDKRNKRIHLTPKGRDMRAKISPHAQSTVLAACAGISQKDMDTCKQVLAQMYQNMNP